MHPLIWPYTKIFSKSIPNLLKILDFSGRNTPDNLYAPTQLYLLDEIHRKIPICPIYKKVSDAIHEKIPIHPTYKKQERPARKTKTTVYSIN